MNIPCYKCGGSGKLRSYGSRLLHACPICKGVGWRLEAIGERHIRDPREIEPTAVGDPSAGLFDEARETQQ